MSGTAWSSNASAEPFAYVTNYGDSTFSVIDAATNVATPAISTQGLAPMGVAVSPDAKRIYIANVNTATGASFPGSVSVVDATTKAIVANITVPFAQAVAVSPDGKRVYVASAGLDTITVIDVATNVASSPIAGLQALPSALTVSVDGKRLYVAVSGGVIVIDLATYGVVARVAAPAGFSANIGGLATTPDGRRIYATSAVLGDFGMSNVNSLFTIDTLTNSVTANIPLPNALASSAASAIAVSPDGKSVYAPDNTAGQIWVYDTAANTVSSIPVDGAARAIAFTPEGKRAYVPLRSLNKTSVIDTATKTVLGSVAVSSTPLGVGIAPAPTGLPFASMTASLSVGSRKDAFQLSAQFTASSQGDGVKPLTEPVRLLVGPYLVTIPANAFKLSNGSAVYSGVIGGASLNVKIKPVGGLSYSLSATASKVNMRGVTNPVPVSFSIGDDAGRVSVNSRL